MTVLKFECPSCNQHLECDRVLSGDIIHCPRCCAELRIPFETTAHIEGTVACAELVTPAATAAAVDLVISKPSNIEEFRAAVRQLPTKT